jgi:hypothetical protein
MFIAKENPKRSIIKEGARLVHSKGFNNTGLSDALRAANVPTCQNGFKGMNFCGGCPIGNLMQEMSDQNEDFRVKVDDVYSGMNGF